MSEPFDEIINSQIIKAKQEIYENRISHEKYYCRDNSLSHVSKKILKLIQIINRYTYKVERNICVSKYNLEKRSKKDNVINSFLGLTVNMKICDSLMNTFNAIKKAIKSEMNLLKLIYGKENKFMKDGFDDLERMRDNRWAYGGIYTCYGVDKNKIKISRWQLRRCAEHALNNAKMMMNSDDAIIVANAWATIANNMCKCMFGSERERMSDIFDRTRTEQMQEMETKVQKDWPIAEQMTWEYEKNMASRTHIKTKCIIDELECGGKICEKTKFEAVAEAWKISAHMWNEVVGFMTTPTMEWKRNTLISCAYAHKNLALARESEIKAQKDLAATWFWVSAAEKTLVKSMKMANLWKQVADDWREAVIMCDQALFVDDGDDEY